MSRVYGSLGFRGLARVEAFTHVEASATFTFAFHVEHRAQSIVGWVKLLLLISTATFPKGPCTQTVYT